MEGYVVHMSFLYFQSNEMKITKVFNTRYTGLKDICYKVTTKKEKKISIAHNSLQLNLLFMRSDPESNQRYETDPINT